MREPGPTGVSSAPISPFQQSAEAASLSADPDPTMGPSLEPGRHRRPARGRRAEGAARAFVPRPVAQATAVVGERLWGPLPTTTAGVETALVLALAGTWLVTIVQLAIALPSSVAHSTFALLNGVLGVGWLAWRAAVLTLVLRRRSVVAPRLLVAEVVLAIVVLATQPLFTAAEGRFYSWDAWGFAVTVSAALWVGMSAPSMTRALLVSGLLAAVYLGAILPGAADADRLMTPITNALAYLAFGALGRLGSHYLRRLGAAADAGRTEAAEAARQVEREQHRQLLHDQATILRLLATPDLPPAVLSALRSQAALGAAQIRSFMDERHVDDSKGTLGVALRSAARQFPDLPLVVTVDLVDEVVIEQATAAAVRDAVVTLLHNVRVHAHAQECVLHGDVEGGEWEVVVTDDGVGFDLEWTPRGYGLARLVTGALGQAGCTVSVRSALGEGTSVTLRGPLTSR